MDRQPILTPTAPDPAPGCHQHALVEHLLATLTPLLRRPRLVGAYVPDEDPGGDEGGDGKGRLRVRRGDIEIPVGALADLIRSKELLCSHHSGRGGWVARTSVVHWL